jgi:hypothetical protein
MEGKISMMDLIFAKEYRGMPGYKPGACVPSLIAIQRRCSCHDITVDNLNTSKVVEETELSVQNHRRVTSH